MRVLERVKRREKRKDGEKTESRDERSREGKKVHDCFGCEGVAHRCGTLDDGADLLATGRECLERGNEQVTVALGIPGVSVSGHVG